MYCFSILNNPKRKADIKKILSVLKTTRPGMTLLVSSCAKSTRFLISKQCGSIFKNNHELTNQLIDVLIDLDIPVQINTRGGYGWQEASEKLKPSLWYVSVPYSDDEVRKLYEPNAPSLDERFEMVKKSSRNIK